MRKGKTKVAFYKQLRRRTKRAAEKTVLSLVAFILIFNMCSMQFLFLGADIAKAADGSGTMTVDDNDATAGAAEQIFKFTFKPSEDMDGGAVRLTIPDEWPSPQKGDLDEDGDIEVEERSGADLDADSEGDDGYGEPDVSIDEREITIDIDTMSANQYFTLKYNVDTIPTTAGDYEFTTESKLASGSFEELSDSDKYTIEIEPSTLDHYEFDTIDEQIVGVDFDVAVTAYDQHDNVTLGESSVDISVATGEGSLHGTTVADTSVDGEDTVTLHYDTVETGVELSVNDETTTSNNSNAFDVVNVSKPSLANPADGAATNDPTQSFDWDNVQGEGVEYNFEVDTVDTFDSGNLIQETGLTSSEYTLSSSQSLGSSGTHYWRVEALDSYENESGWSDVYQFDLQTATPDEPNDSYIKETDDNPKDYINKYTTDSTTVTVETADGDVISDGSTVYVELSDGTHTVSDSATYNGGDSTNSFDVTVDTGSLYQGSISIEARIVDKFGNQNIDGYVAGTSATKDIDSAGIPSLTAEDDTNNAEPTLEWSSVSEAEKYHLQLDDNGDFNSPEIEVEDLSEANYDVGSGEISSDGTYYWRIRSKDVAWNFSNWSSADEFIVDTTNPNSSIKTDGIYNANSWTEEIEGSASDATAGVDLVEIALQNDDSQYYDGKSWTDEETWIEASGTTVWNYSFSPQDGESYTVQSRATDAVGNQETDLASKSFSYDETAPNDVVLSSPADGASLSNTTPTFEWEDLDSDEENYVLKVDESGSDFSDPVYSETVGADTVSVTIPSDSSLTDGDYDWKVYAIDEAGNKDESGASVWSFSVDTNPPGNPTISIADGDNVTTTSTPDLTLGSGSETPNEMRFSCDENNWSDWVDWTTSYSGFDITTGAGCSGSDGEKTVYVQGRDSAGNETDSASDTIIYDSDETLTVDGSDSAGADFTVIQDAVDNAQSGWIIDVAAGVYNENVDVNKTLTLNGPQAGVNPVIGERNDSGAEAVVDGGASEAISVNAGNVVVDGFRVTMSGLDDSGKNAGIAINDSSANNAIIKNNIVRDIEDSNEDEATYGILSWGSPDGVEIKQNLVTNVERYGIAVNDNSSNVKVSGNRVASLIGSNTSSGYLAAAIGLGGETSGPSEVTITDNTLSTGLSGDGKSLEGSAGLAIGFDGNDFSGIAINDNDLSGNSFGVNSQSNSTINADNNWWGSKEKTTVASLASGNVTYDPWYLEAEMNTLSDTDEIGPVVSLSDDQDNVFVEGEETVVIDASITDDNGLDSGVTPKITIDNGGGVSDVDMEDAGDDDPETWQYTWDVPSGVDADVSVSVTAQDIVGNEVSEITGTDAYTVDNTNPAVTVDTPNGGEFWAGGSKEDITWTTDDTNKGTVDIDYTTEGGSDWMNIVSGENDDGSYSWTLPDDLNSSDVKVKVTATDKAGNTGSDQSDASFTVDSTNPEITGAVIKADSASDGGYIKKGDQYYVYVQVDESGSGIESVTGDFSNVTSGTDSKGLTSGSYDEDYNYRSDSLTAESDLTEGDKDYTIDAIDNAGNAASQLSYSVTVDNTAPSNLNANMQAASGDETGLTSGNWYNYSSPYADWTIPEDTGDNSSGVAGYYVCVDANASNDCNPASSEDNFQTETNYTLSDLTNGETYYLRTKTIDNAGNISDTVEQFVYKYDNEDPINADVEVTDEGEYTNSEDTLVANWDDFSDNIGVESYEYSIGTSADSTDIKKWTDAEGDNSVTDSSLSLSSGVTYYVNVRALDEAGNASDTVSSDGITVDTEDPEGSNASSPDYANSTFDVSWTAGTDNGPSGLNGRYRVKYKDQSGGEWEDWFASTESNSKTFGNGDPLNLENGHKYYFEAGAKDKAGNEEKFTGEAGETSTIYDTSAPNNPTVEGYKNDTKETSLESGNWYNYTAPHFAWSEPGDLPNDNGLVNSGVAGYYVCLDKEDSCEPDSSEDNFQESSSYTVSQDLTSGETYYLRTKTKDNAGNVSDTATVFTYKFDEDAPKNPTTPASAWVSSDKNTSLNSGSWYNYTAPYFEWSGVSDNPDDANAGLKQYYVGQTINDSYDPTGNETAGTNFSFDLSSKDSDSYYLRIKAEDKADSEANPAEDGNMSIPVTAFTYNFDKDAPTTSVTGVSPSYNSGSSEYLKGDVTISGTAGDNGLSGVSKTEVQIKDSAAGEYWDGSSWTDAENWLDTEETTDWSYTTSDLDLSGKNSNTLEIKSRSYDSVNGGGANGNMATSEAYSVVVDIEQPSFETDNTSTKGTTGETFTFSQDVTDSESGLEYVQVEYWYGSGSHTTVAMNEDSGDTYTKEITLPSDSLDTLHYFFKAGDNVGNSEITTNTKDVTISDNDSPSVEVITKDTTATAGKAKTIEADVEDNIEVDAVDIYYRNHGGSWSSKAMSSASGDNQSGTWEVDIDAQQSTTGKMNYYVVADDTAENEEKDDKSGEYYDIDINAGDLASYKVYSDTDQIIAGESFIVTVIAEDEFGNEVTPDTQADLSIKGWNGSSYEDLNPDSYTINPSAISFSSSVGSANVTIEGSGETSYDTIRIIATDSEQDMISGYTEVDAESFNATAAGGVGVEGTKSADDPVVSKEGNQASANQPASSPWKKALPYALGGLGALAFVGIGSKWWWRGGKGPKGGGGTNFFGFLFSTFKTAATKIRMFIW